MPSPDSAHLGSGAYVSVTEVGLLRLVDTGGMGAPEEKTVFLTPDEYRALVRFADAAGFARPEATNA